MRYKVSFTGWAYVEADSEEEAREKVMYEDDAIYKEEECTSVEEMDDFVVDLNADNFMVDLED